MNPIRYLGLNRQIWLNTPWLELEFSIQLVLTGWQVLTNLGYKLLLKISVVWSSFLPDTRTF